MNRASSKSVSAVPLRVEQLTKTFGGLEAVKSISLALQPGELLSLIGPNGAGKTTLIRMLTGILQADGGNIFLHGRIRPDRGRISHDIGYCPQRIIVWKDLTCWEQLLLVAQMYKLPSNVATTRVSELLDMLNLCDKRDALASTLSGGMQRRLSIGLAMVHRPSILVLDEPEAGLDPQSRVLIRDTMHSLRKATQTSIIVSTHDMAEAQSISTRVAIMNHGHLLALDTPEALLKNAGSSHLVELRLENVPRSSINRFIFALEKLNTPMRESEQTVVLDSDSSDALVRPIRTIAAQEDVSIFELRHRRRTLEDVFLFLTRGSKKAAS